jgi:hypothetical protein
VRNRAKTRVLRPDGAAKAWGKTRAPRACRALTEMCDEAERAVPGDRTAAPPGKSSGLGQVPRPKNAPNAAGRRPSAA